MAATTTATTTVGSDAGASPAPSPSGSTILRIKRKRGQDPVEALLIDQQRSLKRRSSAALGADPSTEGAESVATRKQGRASTGTSRLQDGKGYFRFAETVPLASFDDQAETLRLRQRLDTLAKSKGGGSGDVRLHPSLPLSGSRSLSSSLHGASSLRHETPRAVSYNDNAGPSTSKEPQRTLASSTSGLPDSASRARPAVDESNVSFRVLKKGLGRKSLSRTGSSASLKFSSAKADAIGSKSTPSTPLHGFKRIIDVVAVSGQSSHSSRASSRRPRDRSNRQTDGQAEKKSLPKEPADSHELDGVDERFADMLGQYLQLQDLPPPTDLSSSALERFSSASGQRRPSADALSLSSDSSSDDSDDYVYDIYYRDFTSGGLSSSMPSRAARSGDADIGLAPAQVQGHVGVKSIAPAAYHTGSAVPAELPLPWSSSYAHLAGFVDDSDSDSDTSEEGARAAAGLPPAPTIRRPHTARLVVDGPGLLGEEWDEGEDEDSNDEGFYRNEYPEREAEDEGGEGRSSDEEEEDSDDEDW